MDRDDARFVASALASRIAGDREELDRLRASSLTELSALATVLRKRAAGWQPALYGAAELMAIARLGGAICDYPLAPVLQKLVDSLCDLLAEPPAKPNRAERRARASSLPRADRRALIAPPAPRLVH
jgi:hypothetical protein